MTDIISQCQENGTRLLGQLKRVISHQHTLLKHSYNTVVCKLNNQLSTEEYTAAPHTCERGDLEIQLTIVSDKRGKLVLPSHRVIQLENNNQYLASPIAPIPTPKRLTIKSTIKVTSRRPSRGGVFKLTTTTTTTTDHKHLTKSSSKRNSHLDEIKMDLSQHICSDSYMEPPEMARLDYKDTSQLPVMDEPISCEVKSVIRGREDAMSSCDSGYEHSDLDDNGCHSPLSVTSISTTTHSSPVSSPSPTRSSLSQLPGRRRPSDSSCDFSVIECTPVNDTSPSNDANTFPQIRCNGNPCLPSPVQFNTTIINHFTIPLEHSTDDSPHEEEESSVIQTLECDMTGFSYSASLENSVENHNRTMYTVTSHYTDSSRKTSSTLNTTDLESEISQALRKSLLDELHDAEDSENEADDTESEAGVVENTLLMSRTVSVSTELLCEELQQSEGQILQQIDRRREELHRMVDNWHGWITQQVQGSYNREQQRLNSEANKRSVVAGVSSPVKTMYSFLNTREKLTRDTFGTFHSDTARREHTREKRVRNHFLCETEHVRTFETRDKDMDTEYMATGLNIDGEDNYTVTDLGADTCRIFSSSGRLLTDFDISPLDEPTYALPDIASGNTVLACRTGLKCYSDNSLHSVTLAKQDVKCPQCIAMDAVGNYVISDMHDCGSVIVTLERNTLLPVRMFCGTQYDDYPQSFTRAWYIHVTRGGTVVLSDRDDHMIKAYSAHGEFLWSAGGLGAQPGKFFTPAGITEDQLGNLLVADMNNNRVQVFSQTGSWLGVVIGNDMEEGLKSPTDVAIDSSGNLAILLSTGTVCIYSYLHT